MLNALALLLVFQLSDEVLVQWLKGIHAERNRRYIFRSGHGLERSGHRDSCAVGIESVDGVITKQNKAIAPEDCNLHEVAIGSHGL